jgi:ELWxxDGT repeat protein
MREFTSAVNAPFRRHLPLAYLPAASVWRPKVAATVRGAPKGEETRLMANKNSFKPSYRGTAAESLVWSMTRCAIAAAAVLFALLSSRCRRVPALTACGPIRDPYLRPLHHRTLNFVALGDDVHTASPQPFAGRELWRTDATGTVRVATAAGGRFDLTPDHLTALGGVAFSSGRHDTGVELWSSDGKKPARAEGRASRRGRIPPISSPAAKRRREGASWAQRRHRAGTVRVQTQ